MVFILLEEEEEDDDRDILGIAENMYTAKREWCEVVGRVVVVESTGV
jgi:hypothetical protein